MRIISTLLIAAGLGLIVLAIWTIREPAHTVHADQPDRDLGLIPAGQTVTVLFQLSNTTGHTAHFIGLEEC